MQIKFDNFQKMIIAIILLLMFVAVFFGILFSLAQIPGISTYTIGRYPSYFYISLLLAFAYVSFYFELRARVIRIINDPSSIKESDLI